MKAISLFSSAGIGNLYLKNIGIDVVVANELLEKRAKFYKEMNPNAKVIVGDINLRETKDKINDNITDDIKLLIATPPCQGVSSLGKNKEQEDWIMDERNFLIYNVFEIIEKNNFDYILIENVSRFLKMYFPYKGEMLLLEDLIKEKYSEKYEIKCDVYNAMDYGVPQSRPRAIIRLFKHGLYWTDPVKKDIITLEEAIGHLPSLESGETTDIKHHNAKWHNDREVLAMKNTATGSSAMKNETFYPKKENGERVKGFHNTYKRMKWSEPAPARTMNSGNIGSHNNVHPGRKNENGTYSDARVLTLRELFIVASIDPDIDLPEWVTDNFMRQIIGESVPPKLMNEILRGINGKMDIQ